MANSASTSAAIFSHLRQYQPESSDVLLPHTLHFICITSMMTLVFLLLEKPKLGKNTALRTNALSQGKLNMISIEK